MTRVPSGSYFTDFFGATNLPFGLAALLSPMAGKWPAAAMPLRILPWLLSALLLFYCLRGAVATMARRAAPVARLSESERLFLVVGTAVIVGCFFTGQSIDYRGIFFLLLLPGLLTLARDKEHGEFLVTAWMVVFLMWGEMIRQALQHASFGDPGVATAWQALKVAFWMVRELIWWRVVGMLLGLLLCFAIGAGTVTAARLEFRDFGRARQ
jgi:hypothetical protein